MFDDENLICCGHFDGSICVNCESENYGKDCDFFSVNDCIYYEI